jgi:hypothetical protein
MLLRHVINEFSSKELLNYMTFNCPYPSFSFLSDVSHLLISLCS